jgi:acyl carrier protein
MPKETDILRETGTQANIPSAKAIQEWLILKISELLGITRGEIIVTEPFASYGMSSMAAVSMAGDLEDWLGFRLSPTLAWDYPTVESLAQHLAGAALAQASASTAPTKLYGGGSARTARGKATA